MDAKSRGSEIALSEVGGTVTSWRVGGRNIIYAPREILKQNKKIIRGGSHWCFPNFGPVDAKFGLPRHGILRDLKGVRDGDADAPFKRVRFYRVGPLGTEGAYAYVTVEAQTFAGGFVHSLRTLFSSEATCDVFINAGIHPYFSTPEETATVISGGERFDVQGLIPKAQFMPLRQSVYVNITGVGMIRIEPKLGFNPAHARLVLWRDSLKYLCVELVMGRPALFGGDPCQRIYKRDPQEFILSCSFTLL